MRRSRGPVGRVSDVAGNVAAAARRRQERRRPRVVLYDAAGQPRVLGANAPAFEGLVEAGERLVGLVGGEGPAWAGRDEERGSPLSAQADE